MPTAAEIADARELPIQADRAHEVRASDLVVADVVDLHSTVIDVGTPGTGFFVCANSFKQSHSNR